MSIEQSSEDLGYENYPALPPGFISTRYTEIGAELGVDMPDELGVVDSFADITPEMIELHRKFTAKPSWFRRIGDKILYHVGYVKD